AAACEAGPAALARATQELAELDRAITALDDAGDAAPLTARLNALLDSPCLRLARLTRRELSPDSARSLRRFWQDGGRAWLRSALRGLPTAADPVVFFPPDTRRTLGAD